MGHCAARAGPRMTSWAMTATNAKRIAAPLNAVARGIDLVLGTKPNSAQMSMLSPDFHGIKEPKCTLRFLIMRMHFS